MMMQVAVLHYIMVTAVRRSTVLGLVLLLLLLLLYYYYYYDHNREPPIYGQGTAHKESRQRPTPLGAIHLPLLLL